MWGTQQHQILQRCWPVVLPGDDVMRVAVSGWPVAAGKHASFVTGMHGVADVGGDEALFASHIERCRGAAQDGRDDARVACPPAQLSGRQFGAVDQTGVKSPEVV